MKHSHSKNLGKLFLIIGIALMGIWSYARFMPIDSPEEALPQAIQISGAEKKANQARSTIEEVINPTLSMGVVELIVEDREKVSKFYRDIVGFDLIYESGSTIDLGENEESFLRLTEMKGLTFPKRSEAGLYHIAITHNSRKDLAQRVKNILEKMPDRYQGSADHGATEAFYFSDPEGNGVELYYDKPRKDWQWQDGKPVMGSTPLDAISYIEKYADLPVGGGVTKMGHVHLKVGNILEAKQFYEDILLFEEMSNRGDALFISRDRYHHHLGMNTWESAGAGKRRENTYGLGSFEIIYQDQYLYEQVRNNLRRNSSPVEFVPPSSIKTEDPWGNQIIIRLELR